MRPFKAGRQVCRKPIHSPIWAAPRVQLRACRFIDARQISCVETTPAGEFLGEDFHRAGGIPAVIGELLRGEIIDGEAHTVSGRSVAEEYGGRISSDERVIRSRNAPLRERLGTLARQLYGSSDPRSVDAVARAIADLPYAVVRRHAHDERMPSWLEADVAASARAVLESFGERP